MTTELELLQLIIDSFDGDHELAQRSTAIAEDLNVHHSRVLDAMQAHINAGRLVGATVMKPGCVKEIEARLALGAKHGGAAPGAAPSAAQVKARQRDSDAKRVRILAVLARSKTAMSARTVAVELGETHAAVHYLLTTMERDRVVVKEGYGRWTAWRPAVRGDHDPAAVSAPAPAAVPKAPLKPRTPRANLRDQYADLRELDAEPLSQERIAEMHAEQLVVGLFSDGHLELTIGAERMRLKPGNTKILFDFLGKFSELAEEAAA